MMETKVIRSFFAGFVVCFVLWTVAAGKQVLQLAPDETRIDTVVIRDTVRDTIPVPVTRYVTRVVRDTVLRIVRDTVANTQFVEVPIETARYKTDEYDAVVEGYNPRLVSMEIFRTTSFVTKEAPVVVKKRWGVGPHFGYGYTPGAGFRPYVGIGVQYNVFVW